MRNGRKRFYDGVVDLPAGRSGAVEIQHKVEPPGTVLQTGNARTAFHGQPHEAVTFPEATRWHSLVEDDHGVWMTDLPIEQRQMDELVKHAKGRVLVGGLGVGYAVIALAVRKAVTEIVVVERSADIIRLVWEPTLARVAFWCEHFRVPVPALSVVQADLFDYLRGRQVGVGLSLKRSRPVFDWALYDIWQSDGEWVFHETVLPLRRLSRGVVKTVSCWNENIMRAQLYRGLESRLMMLRAGTPDLKAMVNLDALCTVSGNVYTDWAVPFWVWYQTYGEKLSQEAVLRWAMNYVVTYEAPAVALDQRVAAGR